MTTGMKTSHAHDATLFLFEELGFFGGGSSVPASPSRWMLAVGARVRIQGIGEWMAGWLGGEVNALKVRMMRRCSGQGKGRRQKGFQWRDSTMNPHLDILRILVLRKPAGE
jgi:hypothetical protein